MAFYRVDCVACQHTFYRVEVRCDDYPESYACPACSATQTAKVAIEPAVGEKSAEDNPCCKEGSTHKKSNCSSCSGCG